ncbi:DMT family transporter [Nitrospirillum pindoramense]|uniref:Transporter family-2 protein n=1 Tax=Nitrospirillum amazonense TaxID=28077 RepID=A0A560GQK9_9PROT|nr:DMT family transporter [Nitrospirillum amazonense]TWB35770.1 transporter family-2 protein [Nitrospirillum amazonense]
MPAPAILLSCLLVIAAGASLAVQQVLNANLRAALGSPWWAGFTSYLVGMLAMLTVALAAPGPRPSLAALRGAGWPAWTGGLFGAAFIATAILMIPRLGAATVLALIVVGQMLCGVAIDHVGALGITPHPAGPLRLLGAGLLVLGVLLVRR